MSRPLACPSCATTHPLEERFCPTCGMPLVYAGTSGVGEPVTATHLRARKIKPQYAEGELVKVARASNQAEGEFIQGLLLEEGVPSMMRRAAGFDVPDFLAAGPRDVLVPRSGADVAREVLLAARVLGDEPSGEGPRALRVLAGLLGGGGLIALVLWAGTQLVR